jgi:hypothetical protein
MLSWWKIILLINKVYTVDKTTHPLLLQDSVLGREQIIRPLKHNSQLDWVWNVMAHAQKPVFVFQRNGRVHSNLRVASVQSTTGSRVVRISGSNAGYIMYRGRVKSTGYTLHSPVSPSLPLPCVTVCHHISTELYLMRTLARYTQDKKVQ